MFYGNELLAIKYRICMPSFYKYLYRAYYIPDTVLGVPDSTVRKRQMSAFVKLKRGEAANKQIHI